LLLHAFEQSVNPTGSHEAVITALSLLLEGIKFLIHGNKNP